MITTYVIVLGVYMVLSLGIAFYVGGRNTKTEEDFTVAGRSFGGFVLFFTLLATIVGASSVMSRSYKFYQQGMAQIWYVLGIVVSYALYIWYLCPRISDFGRNHGGETVGDWMEFRYGKANKYVSSILIAVAYIAITAFQYIAMATIINLVTGINYNVCMVVTALIVIIYTSFGGLWAVASTDVIQGIMTLIGCVVMVPVFISKAGGWSNVAAAIPAENLKLFGNGITPLGAISAMLVFGLGIISWPDIWQRCYAAKDKKTLKKSMILFVLATFVISGLMLIVGFTANVLVTDGSAVGSSTMLPMMVMQYMPSVGGALILAALVAVIMGTADSTLLVSAVIVEKDLIRPLIKGTMSRKKSLLLSKAVTAICGISVLGVLFFSMDMFDLWVMSADITGATLAVPILLGFCWKKPTAKASMASILAGFAGWAASYAGLIKLDAILLGALLSLIAYVAVGLMEKGNDATRELY